MRAMKLYRLGAGAVLSSVILVAWLGACSNGDEACGINGILNGICRQGPKCPSGQSMLNISDPSEECPQGNVPQDDFICCVPAGSDDASVGGAPADSGAPVEDAAKGATTG
jgi:hypothetical protein